MQLIRSQPVMLYGLLLACSLSLAFSFSPTGAQENAAAETIPVSGIQPGPPLWRVARGEHVLWILPIGSIVPQNMVWENEEVADIIANAEEFIRPPDISVGVSKTLVLNPINIFRGIELYKRIRRNAGNASLAEVLPADVYRRFSDLKAKYFPTNEDVETLRPMFAAEVITKEIPPQEQLAGFQVITQRVNELIEERKDIRVTDVKVELTLGGSFDDLSRRVDGAMTSLTIEREIECFESQLTRYEKDLDSIRQLANAWATGDVGKIVDFARAGGLEAECSSWFLAGPEGGLALETLEESRQRWFEAAVSALERNRTTFSMLPISYITGDLSLVNRLANRGYDVHEPR